MYASTLKAEAKIQPLEFQNQQAVPHPASVSMIGLTLQIEKFQKIR